jgi:hypothetical protein
MSVVAERGAGCAVVIQMLYREGFWLGAAFHQSLACKRAALIGEYVERKHHGGCGQLPCSRGGLRQPHQVIIGVPQCPPGA